MRKIRKGSSNVNKTTCSSPSEKAKKMKQLKTQYKNGNAVHSGLSNNTTCSKTRVNAVPCRSKNENIFEEKRLCVQFPLSLNKIIQPKIFYYTVAM